MPTIRALAIAAAVSGCAFGQSISGRLLYPDGDPLGFASVRLKPADARDSRPPIDIQTDWNGVFAFHAVQPGRYKLQFLIGGFKAPYPIDVTAGKDIDIGVVTLERCPAFGDLAAPGRPASAPLRGDLKLEQIVIEAREPDDGNWGTMDLPGLDAANTAFEEPACWPGMVSLNRREEWEGLCQIYFTDYVSIEAFLGHDTLFGGKGFQLPKPAFGWEPFAKAEAIPADRKVRAIRVTRVRSDPPLTPAQIKQEVRRVWLGVFWDASCYLGWAEGNFWNIQASVEYEDGERASLLTDGGHVQVQDRQGKYWFIRLWPAVD